MIGFLPPPSRVPNPPAEAASGIRMMKNLERLLLFAGVIPIAANTGRKLKRSMIVIVASWNIDERNAAAIARMKLSFFTLVPAALTIIFRILFATPASLRTTPNIMIMRTNMTAGLANGFHAAAGFWILKRISPPAARSAVVPMGSASETHKMIIVASRARNLWPSGESPSGLGNTK